MNQKVLNEQIIENLEKLATFGEVVAETLGQVEKKVVNIHAQLEEIEERLRRLEAATHTII